MKTNKILSLMLVLSILISTACKDDDNTDNSGVPTVSSYTPQQGYPGTIVLVSGSGFGTDDSELAIRVGDVECVGEAIDSNERIRFTIPSDATEGTGKIILSLGEYTIDNIGDFNINKAQEILPVVDSIAPRVGYPGTRVTIYGKEFGIHSSAIQIKAANEVATDFTLISEKEITFTLPEGVEGEAEVALTVGGKAPASPIGNFIVHTPVVTTYSPKNGDAGSTSVSLTGQNLYNLTDDVVVRVSEIGATVTKQTESEVVFTVPMEVPAGAAMIELISYGDTIEVGEIEVRLPAPVVTDYAPKNGYAGVTEVTLTGSYFGADVEAIAIKVGDVDAATITLVSGSELKFVMPAGIETGATISLTVGEKTVVEPTGEFTLNTPSILNYTPTEGGAGSTVTITGEYLYDGLNDVSLTVGGVSVEEITSQTETQITFIVPAITESTNSIVLSTYVADPITVGDFMRLQPQFEAMTPSAGGVGDIIAITGANLYDGSNDVLVKVGEELAVINSQTATAVEFIIPNLVANSYSVVLETMGQQLPCGSLEIESALPTGDVSAIYLQNYSQTFTPDDNYPIYGGWAATPKYWSVNEAGKVFDVDGVKTGGLDVGDSDCIGYVTNPSNVENAQVYQKITLPAGNYTYSVVTSERVKKSIYLNYLAAVEGDGLVEVNTSTENLDGNTLGSVKIDSESENNTFSLNFQLTEEKEISLGIIVFMTGRWSSLKCVEFKLERQN